jgi:stage V sporulation protein G
MPAKDFYLIIILSVVIGLLLIRTIMARVARRRKSRRIEQGLAEYYAMSTQITEVKIYPTDEDLVKAHVTITFDNCIEIREIKVIKSSTGLFVSMPARKQKDGSHRYIAYPANTEIRKNIQRVILAEYEKIVGERDPVPSTRSASEGLRALGQNRWLNKRSRI